MGRETKAFISKRIKLEDKSNVGKNL